MISDKPKRGRPPGNYARKPPVRPAVRPQSAIMSPPEAPTSISTDPIASPAAPPKEKLVAAQKELALRELSRRRLLHFVQRLNPKYLAGWVHEDICLRLERFSDQVAHGLSPHLMIMMPPRHGKSELASRSFPAWHLGRHPYHEFIACSYNQALSLTFSRRVKMTLEDPLYKSVFPETQLDPNNQSAEEWAVHGKAGGYVAAGVGGGITGRGAHVLVIDDPIKSSEEADSQTVRESIWDWFTSTAYTRLAPGGGVLIIQTCWHDDDLAGHIQQMMAEDPDFPQFELVKYPAIADQYEFQDPTTRLITQVERPEDAPDGSTLLRSPGEPLHPARYDLQKLLRIKKTLPVRHWSALYQQNPVPDDGIFFSREQFRQLPPPTKQGCYVIQAWDFAISERQHNDWTVGVCMLQDHNDVLHVVEVVRFKKSDAFFIAEAILGLAQRWKHPSLEIGVEDGQIWRALSHVVSKRMRETNFYPRLTPVKALTDKKARASTLQGRMQQGMVSFDMSAGWFQPLKAEFLRFPAGVHDDIVDACAHGAIVAMDKPPPQLPKSKKLPSWKDKLNMSARGGGHMAA